ncbi:MAG: hypothetical protein WC869_00020 [Phycisphaerae bacterium]|jgi:hypothetical protein
MADRWITGHVYAPKSPRVEPRYFVVVERNDGKQIGAEWCTRADQPEVSRMFGYTQSDHEEWLPVHRWPFEFFTDLGTWYDFCPGQQLLVRPGMKPFLSPATSK